MDISTTKLETLPLSSEIIDADGVVSSISELVNTIDEKVSKAGDIMSGDLSISNASFC